MKESEKKDKYLDLARELKKLRNMKVTVIPIAVGALGTVPKFTEKILEELETRGESKPFRSQHCEDWLEFSDGSWKPEVTFFHSDSIRIISTKINNKNGICKIEDFGVPADH